MDRHGLWLEQYAQQASGVLQKFTNEQLDIIKQVFQQNRFPDLQTEFLLAQQFNIELDYIRTCFRYYRFQTKVDDRRRRLMPRIAA